MQSRPGLHGPQWDGSQCEDGDNHIHPLHSLLNPFAVLDFVRATDHPVRVETYRVLTALGLLVNRLVQSIKAKLVGLKFHAFSGHDVAGLSLGSPTTLR